MSVKEQFYNQRPAVLFDPRASQRIDPRFTFTRNSTGTYVDASGVIRTAGLNQPRIEFNAMTGALRGLLVENSKTNIVIQSSDFSTWNNTAISYASNVAIAPDGTLTADECTVDSVNYIYRSFGSHPGFSTHTWSIFCKSNGGTVFFVSIDDQGSFAGARYDTQFTYSTVSIPATGSIYLDAQANSTAVNDTLLSVANSSDEKLLLQAQAPASLYNSLALVYAIDDTFEPTLPFPVPEPGDQRNIITWGDNNYHYQKSNYRKTPSLTASIPENLDRIGIGHDVTDPTKGFNGTISRLYLWANELPPEIARGLVRGDITVPLNADDENVIPVAAHALIFNTQGPSFHWRQSCPLPAPR
jgi:hypothetical protein